MKLTTKKIIAREFLSLILVLTIGLVSFLCTYTYNIFQLNQAENKSTKISEKTKLADSLSILYKSKLDKQDWFVQKFNNHYNFTDDNIRDDRIWKMYDNLAEKDSIKHKWENNWHKSFVEFIKEIGFSNPLAFHSFIEKNRITKLDSSNYDSSVAISMEIALLLKDKKDNESKILSYNEQTEFGLKALIICFIILFGFRYLFYSLKWSLKTLKQKSE